MEQNYDAIYVKQLKSGDVFAFNKLFESYGSRLYGFGFKYLKSEPETEELVQEVFLKIWRNRGRLDASKSFKSYLFTIAFNEIRRAFQKKAALFDLADSYAPELADHSTEHEIAYRSVFAQIDRLLQGLPVRRRQIFELSRFEHLSSKEIAERLGISPKTVDNQVSEVIHYLRDRLSGNLAGMLFLALYVSI